jgi:hypothetical protein
MPSPCPAKIFGLPINRSVQPTGRAQTKARRGHRILRLAKDLSIPELHDTDSVGRLPIITDDIFGNPKIAAPNHPPNGEVLVGKQPPRRPDGEPTMDALAGLGVLPARRRRGRSHPQHRHHRPQTQPSAGPAQLGCLDLPSRFPVCTILPRCAFDMEI